jgi:hypothetical protein
MAADRQIHEDSFRTGVGERKSEEKGRQMGGTTEVVETSVRLKERGDKPVSMSAAGVFMEALFASPTCV